MGAFSEKKQKMADWWKELRFYSTDYSDQQVIDVARQWTENEIR